MKPKPSPCYRSASEVRAACAPSAPLVLHPLAVMAGIRSAADVRVALGLSQMQMGAQLAKAIGRAAKYNRASIAHIEAGREAGRDLCGAYIALLSHYLAQINARWEARGDGWQYAVFAPCARCGESFRVRRMRQVRCGACR